MKAVLIFTAFIISNIILFFILQIISQFVHFFMFGERALSDKYTTPVSSVFMLMQLIILIMLFRKKVILKTPAQLVVNLILVAGLYIYTVILQQ